MGAASERCSCAAIDGGVLYLPLKVCVPVSLNEREGDNQIFVRTRRIFTLPRDTCSKRNDDNDDDDEAGSK